MEPVYRNGYRRASGEYPVKKRLGPQGARLCLAFNRPALTPFIVYMTNKAFYILFIVKNMPFKGRLS